MYLNVDKESCEEFEWNFLKIFCLNKIQWLNAKQNKSWKNDFDEWTSKDTTLPSEIRIKQDVDSLLVSNVSELIGYIKSHTNSSNALLKTYLGIVKTHSVLNDMDEDDVEEYIDQLRMK